MPASIESERAAAQKVFWEVVTGETRVLTRLGYDLRLSFSDDVLRVRVRFPTASVVLEIPGFRPPSAPCETFGWRRRHSGQNQLLSG